MTVLVEQILSAEMPGNLLCMLVTLRAGSQISKREGKKACSSLRIVLVYPCRKETVFT